MSPPKLSASCAHHKPFDNLYGDPKPAPSTMTPPLPTATGRRAAIQHHKEVLLGPLFPLHQEGKTGAPGVVAACSNPQQDAAARYRREGVAAPATCPLQAGTGMALPLTPSLPALPPFLPPKKHFISLHVMVAIANAHALQEPAPTTTRRCLGTNLRLHLGHTDEELRAWSGHPANLLGMGAPKIKAIWLYHIHQQWMQHRGSPASPLQLPSRI